MLPDEYGSYEINPPCLPEFVRRSLRWCQGNLQYLKLVTKPGWPPMARLQLALAILMYLSGPAWLLFMTLGFMQGAFGFSGETIAQNPWGAPPSSLGLWLLAGMITMVFAPKIAGLIETFDPGNEYLVPCNWWTFGIAYNTGKLAERLGDDYQL